MCREKKVVEFKNLSSLLGTFLPPGFLKVCTVCLGLHNQYYQTALPYDDFVVAFKVDKVFSFIWHHSRHCLQLAERDLHALARLICFITRLFRLLRSKTPPFMDSEQWAKSFKLIHGKSPTQVEKNVLFNGQTSGMFFSLLIN